MKLFNRKKELRIVSIKSLGSDKELYGLQVKKLFSWKFCKLYKGGVMQTKSFKWAWEFQDLFFSNSLEEVQICKSIADVYYNGEINTNINEEDDYR